MFKFPERRAVRVESPAGSRLQLHRMTGEESLGQPFLYQAELFGDEEPVEPEELLGETMSLALERLDGDERFFHGVVTRFHYQGVVDGRECYRVELRPWLWLLTRTTDCRIFQQQTAPEIIQQIFRDHGFSDFECSLSRSYPSREFCVQFRESAFDFVTRLMQQEGIYYHLRHEADRHVVVLSDGIGAHVPSAGYEEVRYFPEGGEAMRERDHLSSWAADHRIQSGSYTLNAFDASRPRADLQSRAVEPRGHARADFEVYEFTQEYSDGALGEQRARVCIEATQSQFERFRGSGDVRGLNAGNVFELSGHPRAALDREYLVVATRFTLQSDHDGRGPATEGPIFTTEIEAIDARQPFRSPRTTAKPIVYGPQTATVVGREGEEIWTDSQGRVKVQFHWDRQGRRDENSSCWIRVAQTAAGSRWGGMSIPRVGQEVVVEFLDGDPDAPLITGRVYNEDNPPPLDLPANATQTTFKSKSSQGGNGYSELRFEDKRGSEEIYLRAERDQVIDVRHDRTQSVGRDVSETVGRDRKTTVERDAVVESGRKITIEAGDELELRVGAASIVLRRDGTIALNAVRFEYDADGIEGRAGTSHDIRGAAIRVNC